MFDYVILLMSIVEQYRFVGQGNCSIKTKIE